MNLMLTTHSRHIGGQELRFRYESGDTGFEMILDVPRAADRVYSETVEKGAWTWLEKATLSNAVFRGVTIQQRGREIVIRGDMKIPLIEDYLALLPNELQQAFAPDEKSELVNVEAVQGAPSYKIVNEPPPPVTESTAVFSESESIESSPKNWYKSLGFGKSKTEA